MTRLVSSVRQHFEHTIVIGLGDKRVDIEMPFSLISFFGKYVSRVRMATFQFSSGGDSESFRRTFVCF